jgi:hypothetical protein
MPKKEYIIYKEDFTNPSARIPYRYYVKILTEVYGVIEKKRAKTGGAARAFAVDGIRFVIHEPHKSDLPVSKFYHHKVLGILKAVGKIK